MGFIMLQAVPQEAMNTKCIHEYKERSDTFMKDVSEFS